SSRRRHTRFSRDWSSDVCSSDLTEVIDRIGRHHGQSRRTEVPARRCSACRHALTASLPATKIHSMSLPRNLPKSPFTFGLAAFLCICGLMHAPRTTAASGKDAAREDEFLNPPLAARPGAFWPWLNGHVSLERITFELEEMKAKGMSGADTFGQLAECSAAYQRGRLNPPRKTTRGEEII